MKVWDAFTYFNEIDLLEIRLEELNNIVDKFVICESTYTHAGNPKKLNFDINKYPKFKDKIIYLVDDEVPNKKQIDITKHAQFKGGPAWENENHQRDYLNRQLDGLGVGDFIIVSDLDEIPSAEGVKEAIDKLLVEKNKLVIFTHKTYYYKLNYYALDAMGSKIMGGLTFKTKFNNSPQKVRDYWEGKDIINLKYGWHFGWLGGVEKIRYKFNEFAHQEYRKEGKIEGIIKKKDEMIDMWDRKLYKIPLDNSFPKFLVDNKSKFKEHIDE